MASMTGQSSAAPYVVDLRSKFKWTCCVSLAAVACLMVVPAVGYCYMLSVLDTSTLYIQSIDVKVNNEEDDSIEVMVVGGNVGTKLGSVANWLPPLEASCSINLEGGHADSDVPNVELSSVEATGPVTVQSNGDVSASLTVRADDWPVTVNAAAAALLTASDEKDWGSCHLHSHLFGIIPVSVFESKVKPPVGSMRPGDGSSDTEVEDGSTEVKGAADSKTFQLGHRIFGELDYELGIELCLLENLTGSIQGLERVSLRLPPGKLMMETPRTDGKWLVRTSAVEIPNILDGGCIMNVSTQFQGVLASPLTTFAVEAAQFGDLSINVEHAGDKTGVWSEILKTSLQQVAAQQRLSAHHEGRRLQGVEFKDMDIKLAENKYVSSRIWKDIRKALRASHPIVMTFVAALSSVKKIDKAFQPIARSFGSYLLDKAAAGIGQLPTAPLEDRTRFTATVAAHPADMPGSFTQNGKSREHWVIYASRGLDKNNVTGPVDVTVTAETPAWSGKPPHDLSVFLDVDVNGVVTLSKAVCSWFSIHADLLKADGTMDIAFEASSHYTESTGSYTGSASAKAVNANGQEVLITQLSVTGEGKTLELCRLGFIPYRYAREQWTEIERCYRTVSGQANLKLRRTTALSVSLNTTLDYLPFFGWWPGCDWRSYPSQSYYDCVNHYYHYGWWDSFAEFDNGFKHNTFVTLSDSVGSTTVTFGTPQEILADCMPSTTCVVATNRPAWSSGEVNITTSGDYTFTLDRPTYDSMVRDDDLDGEAASMARSSAVPMRIIMMLGSSLLLGVVQLR